MGKWVDAKVCDSMEKVLLKTTLSMETNLLCVHVDLET